MSRKLAVVFCVVFVASAASSFLLSGTLHVVQTRVDSAINAGITNVRGKTEVAQEKAQRIVAKLLDESKKFGRKIHTEIKTVLRKADDDIIKFAEQADGIDVSDCTDSTTRLDHLALAALSNVTVCIIDKLETGSGYAESINKVSSDVVANLTKIREEVRHCGENSTIGLMSCGNAVVAKASMVSRTVIPEMVIKMTKLNLLLGTVQPSLAYCAATNGLAKFQKESSKTVEEAKTCIQQKINEARPSVQYGTSTTGASTAASITTEVMNTT